MPHADNVRSMFAGISRRYDMANRLLSGGIDIYWRHVLVSSVGRLKPKIIADLATGSGDVAFALRRKLGPQPLIHGLDFCPPMLVEADRKKQARGGDDRLLFAAGDCLDLPLASASVDVVTISFGLRNLEDRARGLAEMHRVLRPGGSLLVLEFSQPYRWLQPVYYAYLRLVLPWLARIATGNRSAYEYLGASIASFPDRPALTRELLAAGFSAVTATPLTGSIVAIHHAVR
jgi:demethylmenaquinone methyltransferase / 2-methoxy-6-polyprenyl-1,4-benzoquinol methylase